MWQSFETFFDVESANIEGPDPDILPPRAPSLMAIFLASLNNGISTIAGSAITSFIDSIRS